MSLLERYQEFYRSSPQMAAIQEAMDPEVLELQETLDSCLEQLSANTATWGLPYWEKTLGLPVEPGKPLDFRRGRVRAKLRGSGVTDVEMIQSVAESFTNGTVEVTEIPKAFKVQIYFTSSHGVPPNQDDLTQSLREIMPAHLAWEYRYLFLLVHHVRHMTLSQLQRQPVKAFAFAPSSFLTIGQIRSAKVGELSNRTLHDFVFPKEDGWNECEN